MRAIDSIRTIADVLPLRTAESPDGVAVQELGADGGLVDTTFAELLQQTEGLAGRLAAAGVESADSVALLMPNSRAWVVAYHAVFRLGAVVVPLEHGFLHSDPERVRFALDHAEARAVVCRPADADAASDVAGPGRTMIGADESGGPPPERPAVDPDDLAQILYTSGTTGPRKGVALTHANVIFDVRQCCRRFGIHPGDCLPAVLPYHHAYPLTTTVILPAFVGARMAVGDVRDRRTRDLLRLCRPTVLICVPRVFESMLAGIKSTATRAGRARSLERAQRLAAVVKAVTGVNVGRLLFRRLHRELFGGRQLRLCISGGARISPRVLREFFLLGVPILQGWGMSELSPVGAVQQFSWRRFYFTRHYERKAGSIGLPLDGTRIRLTDGDEGEMLVVGPHVMAGYHRDPERTARQMVDGALRSGDIARRDADGDLHIIGRIKHVIVLPSGKKVFPEDDLQDALSGCPTIDEFAVRAVTGDDDAERIGIIIRPNVEEIRSRNASTVGELYAAVKGDIDRALEGKPAYMRQYDFCLTEWTGEAYAELVKTTMGDPCPLKNDFRPAAAWSRAKASIAPVPWA